MGDQNVFENTFDKFYSKIMLTRYYDRIGHGHILHASMRTLEKGLKDDRSIFVWHFLDLFLLC